MLKRMDHEIVQLVEYESNKPIPRNIRFINETFRDYNEDHDDDDANNKIKFKILVGNITMLIEDTYPFRPPTIHINDKPYNQFMITHNKIIKQMYEKLEQNSNKCCCCVWCNSIAYKNNWLPSNRLYAILLEIDHMNKIKRTIREILHYNRYVKIICNIRNLPMQPQDLLPYLYQI